MTSSESECSVTIVSQVFHPDTSANSGVLTELATGLASRGFDVDVLTTQPSYTDEDRALSEPKTEYYNGVRVRRLPATRFNRNRGIAYRMANELSFFVAAFCYLLSRRARGTEPLLLPTAPTFLPVLGWILRPVGYQSVPIVMDLYPDLAVELGFLTEDGFVYQVWDWLNQRTYSSVERTVVIGETMETTLRAKYGEMCDTTVIHNWADGGFLKPQPKANNPFAQEHGFLDEMTVLYSGNLGQHHDLESLIDAASTLEEGKNPSVPVHFVFIGEGGKKPMLKKIVADRGLECVSFLPYQPVETLPDSLTSGDIAVVTMEQGVEGLCVSSKFYTALASGSAVLAISSACAEIGSVVERTNCGIRVDPNSPEEIAKAIQYWAENPDKVEQMGSRAREVFEEEFNKEHAISEYQRVLKSINA